jgi:hypothetical protein
VPPVAVHVTALLKFPMPFTVAAHVAVCAVVIEAGVATTPIEVIVTPVEEEIVTLAVPYFVSVWADVAVIVSDPDAGALAGAV